MLRANDAADSQFSMIAFTPGNGAVMLSRSGAGKLTELDREADWQDAGAGEHSKWLRLVRTGEIVASHVSDDGVVWEWVGTQRIELAAAALVGFAISGNADESSFAAEIDQVVLEAVAGRDALPVENLGGNGLLARYFPSPNLSGEAVQRVDGSIDFNWRENAAAEGMSPDRFSVAWDGDLQVPATGDYTFYLASDDRGRLRIGDDWIINERAQHGFEESQARIHLERGQRYPIRVEYFEDRGAAAVSLKWSSELLPKQVVPADNLFAATPEALSARQPAAVVANVSLPADLSEWAATRIGTGRGDVRVERTGQGILVSSAGEDIWTHLDSFAFLHRAGGSAVEISARVVMVDAWHPWAKVGLMIREGSTEDAPNALVAVTPLSGVTAQRREEAGGPTLEDGGGQGGAPIHLKLRRNGDVFTSYRSTDGAQWEWIATQRIPMTGPGLIGLAVSSHDPEKLCRAFFDQVHVTTPSGVMAGGGFGGAGDGLRGNYAGDDGQSLQRLDREVNFDWQSGGPFGEGVQDGFQIAWTGLIEPQFSEPYRLHVVSDDGARLWLDGELVVDAWRDRAAGKSSVGVPLKAGHKYLVKLEYYEGTGLAAAQLRWSSPSTPEQIVPTSQLYSPDHVEFARILDRDGDLILDRWEDLYGLDSTVRNDGEADADGDGLSNRDEFVNGSNPNVADSDGDGLPDGWEVAHGLNPVDASDAWSDSDSDGLSNREEFAAGTNPRAADSDGDGLDDRTELAESGTDPREADDVTVVTAWEMPGSTANRSERWMPIEEGALRSNGRRGVAEYVIPVTTADVYRIEIGLVTKAVGLSTRSDDLVVELDGTRLTRRRLSHETGVPQTIIVFTPWLAPGQHHLRLAWDNVVAGRIIAIGTVKLQSLAGPDSDGDGVKDWVESRLERNSTVTTMPAESLTSPAFVEGRDLFPSLVQLTAGNSGSAVAGVSADRAWYGNIALRPDAPTEVTVEFQHGAKTELHSIAWKALNVIGGGSLTIRRGDSLLLQAASVTTGATDQNVRIQFNGRLLHEGIASDKVPHRFDETGEYRIEGQLLSPQGSIAASDTVTVNVVGYEFPGEPAVLVTRARKWTIPRRGGDVMLESGNSVAWERLPTFSDEEIGSESLALQVAAPDASPLVARLGEHGPILDQTVVRGLRVASAGDTTLRVRERYPDGSDLFEMCMVSSPVLADVSIRMHIIVGGVVFEDGTLDQTLTAAAFDEYGENHVRFVRAADAVHSTCHVTRVYQGEELVGPYVSRED